MNEITHEKIVELTSRAESLVTEANGLIVAHLIKSGETGKRLPQKLLTATGMLMSSSVFIGTAKMYYTKMQADSEEPAPQIADELPMGVEEFLKKMGAIKQEYAPQPDYGIEIPVQGTSKAPDWETYAKSLVSHIASDVPKDSRIKAKQKLLAILDQAIQ